MVGEAVGILSATAASGTLDIKPPAGEEWIVHNVYHDGPATLYKTDGTNTVTIDTDTSGGVWSGFFFHVTNSHYLQVKNDDSSSKVLGYDGIRSK